METSIRYKVVNLTMYQSLNGSRQTRTNALQDYVMAIVPSLLPKEISVLDYLKGKNVIPVADISLHQNT